MTSILPRPLLNCSQLLSVAQAIWLTIIVMLGFSSIAAAQNIPIENQPAKLIIENTYEGDVFSLNKTVVVKGSVTKGVLSFGGDVIVEGRIEGDVATLGGSVYQRPDSFIGGDVIIVGGGYNHGKTAPGRNPHSQTVMYAGYENELREVMQNPISLIAPNFSPAFIVQRIIAVFFWFIISLILNTVTPGAVSRSIIRLQLLSWQIAAAGALAAAAAICLLSFGIVYLPAPIGVAVSLMITAALLLAYVFGRVCVQAATGKYLQNLFLNSSKRSESIALLFGAVFWTAALSIPFIWVIALTGLLVTSFGLILTARAPLTRKANS